MRRDATSATFDGPEIQQERERITAIQRDGYVEIVHTYMEVKIVRTDAKGRSLNEVIEVLRQKGWK